MNPDTYLKDRLEDQINWYSRKASSNKSAYLRIATAVLFIAVSIPLFAIYLLASESPLFPINVWLAYFGFAGLAITVLFVLNHIYNYQDRWSHYRTVGELLKKERNLYKMKSGPYKDHDEPFDLLVERVEKTVSPRNS